MSLVVVCGQYDLLWLAVVNENSPTIQCCLLHGLLLCVLLGLQALSKKRVFEGLVDCKGFSGCFLR